jgi:hypothetical protein
MALSTLYPPIVGTYGKTFLLDSGNAEKDTCKVYFSLSSYNTISEIMNAQVTIVFQDTNRTALDPDKYPCEIMLTSVYKDNNVLSDEKYYIQINKNDIKGKAFQINKYYKVQIRFTSIEATTPNYDGVQDIDNWLAGNQSCFSEWSTVCLVRGISTPRLQISGLDSSAGTTMWTTADTQMIGSVTFANEAETDILKSYQLKLYNNDTGELITNSGLQYANAYNNVNQINYVLKCEFIDDINYKLEVVYTTSLLYESSVEYEFTVSQTSLDILEATIDTIIDAENGRIGVLLQSLNEESVFMGRLTIRRTSSESNYTVWEDVYTTAITDNKALNLVWYDYSVKSGVWYKYCAQRRNSIGARGIAIALENPVMVNYEYCFLVGDNKQLKMKYNTNISSVKRNIAESKVDTIGSKYPFIRRNGDMNYTTFSITGLITRFMDEEEIFTSKEEILNNQNELYDTYNIEHRINEYNDTTYERNFRDRVVDFLYENSIRLFKSPTQGVMLIKLMDISLTPMSGGIDIYTFTASAHEIADYSIENLSKYGIQSSLEYYINDDAEKNKIEDSLSEMARFSAEMATFSRGRALSFDEDTNPITAMGTETPTVDPTWQVAFSQEQNSNISLITYEADYIGQEERVYAGNVEILTALIDKYKRYEREGYEIQIEYFDSLRIEMLGEPYLIEDGAAGPIPATETSDVNSLVAGYIIYINNTPIIIRDNGVYELKGKNVKITSLIVPKDTHMNLEYHAHLIQTEDLSQLVKSVNYYMKVGQKWGMFRYTDSLRSYLMNKYFVDYTTYSQALVAIPGVRVEAEPGTVFYLKETGEMGYQRHIIGDTCELTCYDNDITIDDVYVVGMHFEPANQAELDREIIVDNHYIETNISVAKYTDIIKPEQNRVYTITTPIENNLNGGKNELELSIEDKFNNTNKYIYYHGQFYRFTEDCDIIKPIEALVDYSCEIMKGTFAV